MAVIICRFEILYLIILRCDIGKNGENANYKWNYEKWLEL